MTRKRLKTIAETSAATFLVGIGPADATAIDSWHRDNVVTDLPPQVAGVTYDSKLFTGQVPGLP